MMDIETIVAVNREAAVRAAEVARVPLILTADDIQDARTGSLDGIDIPDLGDYTPDGWTRIDLSDWYTGGQEHMLHGIDLSMNAIFVDYSGFGYSGDPALTIAEFFGMARPGFGYAVVETGQFQLYVGVFQKVRVEGAGE